MLLTLQVLMTHCCRRPSTRASSSTITFRSIIFPHFTATHKKEKNLCTLKSKHARLLNPTKDLGYNQSCFCRAINPHLKKKKKLVSPFSQNFLSLKTKMRIRNLVSRYISTSSLSSTTSTLPQPQFYLNFPKTLNAPQFPQNPNFSLYRHFSSSPLAQSLSKELQKDETLETLSLSQRLDQNIKGLSHFTPSLSLIKSVLHNSPDAKRKVLVFRDWLLKNPKFVPDDDTFASFIDYFGRRGDFKAFSEVMDSGRKVIGVKTMEAYVDRLVRARTPMLAVSFFEKMEEDYGLVRNEESLRIVVEKLCDHGHWLIAENMVKSWGSRLSGEEYLCDLLIKGWCLDGKLGEAKRVAEDMRGSGFKVGTNAYNAMLEYICKLCRQKNQCRFQVEVENILVDMDFGGVRFNAETFKILIEIFCRLERIDYATSVFAKMKEHGFKPGFLTYDLLLEKLVAHNRVDRAHALAKDAASEGVKLAPKAYTIYPKYAFKKQKGWESLHLKAARKAVKEERKKKKQKPDRSAV